MALDTWLWIGIPFPVVFYIAAAIVTTFAAMVYIKATGEWNDFDGYNFPSAIFVVFLGVAWPIVLILSSFHYGSDYLANVIRSRRIEQ